MVTTKRLLMVAAAAWSGAAGMVLAPQTATAVELIKKLPCVFTETSQKDGQHCLKVTNTCNTSIVSRIEDSGGAGKDGPEIRAGDHGEVCSEAPFAFLGHYLTGPLSGN